MKASDLLRLPDPGTMRLGKLLKKRGAEEGLISDLVRSSKYDLAICETFEEVSSALYQCRSCQSRQNIHSDFCRAWYGSGCELAVLLDGEKIIARCLINQEKMTMAKGYGDHHFLLESRLKFAGFSPGELASLKTLSEAIEPPNLVSKGKDKILYLESFLIDDEIKMVKHHLKSMECLNLGSYPTRFRIYRNWDSVRGMWLKEQRGLEKRLSRLLKRKENGETVIRKWTAVAWWSEGDYDKTDVYSDYAREYVWVNRHRGYVYEY